MSASFTQTSAGIEASLNGMISRSKTMSSYLNRTLFQQYQTAQLNRWQTEGSSEKMPWAPLNPKYERYKKKKFASYPGAGNALMIATGHLSAGATAQDSTYFYKQVTDSQFVVGLNVGALPYAPYPGVLRPYMQFSQETMDSWRKGIADYVRANIEAVK